MSLEQTDFLDKLDKSGSEEDQKPEEEKEEKKPDLPKGNKIQKPDDGLNFDCEICQDSPGGCPSCGFGRNR